MKIWVKQDWNGYFGLFTNNLTNLLVMASLLTQVVGLPNDIVFTKIIPATGLAIFVSSSYYTYMAYKLRQKTGVNNVTALPSGISVPHMFLIVFMIIGPIYWSTNDPYVAWYAGIAWCFFEGLVELSGSIIGARVKKYIPRIAMLGSLAGVSITFIALNPAFSVWSIPYIGFVSFAVVLIGWFGKEKMPFNIPVGLIAIILGTTIGWIAGIMDYEVLISSFANIKLAAPSFSLMNIKMGIKEAYPLLAMALPLGIYNFFETIDNLESAEVAGDKYSVREALLTDGLTSILGSVMGSPFPTAVYIGHPGWKDTGAQIGYTLATGMSVLIITWFGLLNVLLSIIPIVAILPILLYIGIVITNQVFTATDSKYYPAGIIALIPWLADWTRNAVDIALRSANISAKNIGFTSINNAGLDYGGMFALGSGAIITSMIWASIGVFIIDHKYKKSVFTSLIGAILSYIGLIHSDSLRLGANIEATLGYILIAIVFTLYLIKNKNKEANVEV